MTKEDKEILRNSWVMTTDHVLDEENKKLKLAISNVLASQDEMIDKHNKMVMDIINQCNYIIANRKYLTDVGIKNTVSKIIDIANYYYIKEPEWSNKMDEDEAINQANTLLKAMRNASERNLNSILFDASITRSDIKAIETILDLYQKEKEENKELSEELTERICKTVEAEVFEEMREELKQEREKNKILEEELQKYISGEYFTEKQVKHLEMTRKMFWINKDKIRENIKLLEDMKQTGRFKQISEEYFKGAIEQLKELLEEN